ncbi:hypothetical protein TSTA_001380, partial [Talaromyces stipitatus ATCC 10500]
TKILPIRDVKTRWNSTFLMLWRTKRLQAIFIPFCTEWERPNLLLNNKEWRQVNYLIWITPPFYEFTTELFKIKDMTTHHVFKIYNLLFEHLENAIPRDLYAVSTMLAPDNKFKFFQTKDWDNELLLKKGKHQPAKPKDEFTEYLDSAIAALTRDALLVPATSTSIKRLFNIAQDICHYCCGKLHMNQLVIMKSNALKKKEERREEDGDDFEDEASPHPVVDVSLPVIEEKATQVRQSVRSRKRPRQEDNQYIYHEEK